MWVAHVEGWKLKLPWTTTLWELSVIFNGVKKNPKGLETVHCPIFIVTLLTACVYFIDKWNTNLCPDALVTTVFGSTVLQHTFLNRILVLHSLTLGVWPPFIWNGSEWTEANLCIKRLQQSFGGFFKVAGWKTDLISCTRRAPAVCVTPSMANSDQVSNSG